MKQAFPLMDLMTIEAPATAVAPAAAPVIVAPTDPNATAAPGPEQKPEEQQPPRTFSQEELNEAIERRLAKERRKREELKRELDVTRKLALEGRGERQPAQPAQPAENGEPKRDDYPDYESYIEARAEWRADRKVEERFNRQRDEEAKSRTVAEQQKLETQFRESAAKAAKEIEDFEEVMESSDAPMTRAMAEAMLTSEIGPRLAYHLAKNPDEAERIAALPAARQAAEIGRLEGKLLAEPQRETKKPSKAPEPIKPVGARSTVSDDMPDPKKDPQGWLKWREGSLRKK